MTSPLGIYPAVDPLDSTSRQLDPKVVGEEHYDRPPVQMTCRSTKELRDIIAILGMDELSPDDKLAVSRAQDPALPVAAVPRGRSVHRFAGQKFVTLRTIKGLQDDRFRRMRCAAGAGVLHGRPAMPITVHCDVVSAEEQIFSGNRRIRRVSGRGGTGCAAAYAAAHPDQARYDPSQRCLPRPIMNWSMFPAACLRCSRT